MSQIEMTNSILTDRIADTAEKACKKSLKLLKAKNQSDFEEAVPKVRDNYKAIRAALRLVRDDRKNYKKENEFYRDEAQKILPVQQAVAAVKAVDLINEQYSDRLYKNAFTELRDKLENHKKKQIETALNEDHIFQELHHNLDSRCAELKNGLSEPISREAISSGLKRVYERGRKALDGLSSSTSNEDFHELQKRANYLKIQLEIFTPIWPEMMDVWKMELEKLSHLLVTSEGLNQLSEFIRTSEDMDAKDDGVYLMGTLIEGHREQVRQHALLLAKKIFSLKAKNFSSFINAAWDVHNSESTQNILPSEKLKLSE